MKKGLEFLGLILLIQGAFAIVRELTDWQLTWGIVQHLDFLHGYELYAGIALVVLSVAVFAAAESSKGG
ncbi:hypothetical protein QIS99_03020 [Streptomyces sp. B-S-A8]|uniref:Uncharacterized protein n=1 Tax=Streptomyces solicavernae TaxID=3043614 RepID=A0ABT6RLQ7_9ACTN|nr:hypothetical protein [Streptomyces sp. B-S-A8]MDI3385194.1 hypothetical protein [Streptomyces sp. B-S-A8]